MVIHGEITDKAVWKEAKTRRNYVNRLERSMKRVLQQELRECGADGVYAVFESELTCRMSDTFNGAYCLYFSHHPEFQSAIASRTSGPSPCVLIDDRDFGRDPAWEMRSFRHVFVHEVAHAMNYETLLPKLPAAINEINQHVTHTIESPLNEWSTPKQLLDDHNHQFIRAVLHLAFRMSKHGWSFNLWNLMEWKRYGFNDPTAYHALLSAELTRHIPIREILDTPAPAAFTDLWAEEACRTEAKGLDSEIWSFLLN